jgi:hypothetical protein
MGGWGSGYVEREAEVQVIYTSGGMRLIKTVGEFFFQIKSPEGWRDSTQIGLNNFITSMAQYFYDKCEHIRRATKEDRWYDDWM